VLKRTKKLLRLTFNQLQFENKNSEGNGKTGEATLERSDSIVKKIDEFDLLLENEFSGSNKDPRKIKPSNPRHYSETSDSEEFLKDLKKVVVEDSELLEQQLDFLSPSSDASSATPRTSVDGNGD